jgi:hypothetical protein
VQQNIKILENYRQVEQLKTVQKLPPAPLKYPKDPGSESPCSGKVTSSPTKHHNEPLRFSTLSEWTLLGGDFSFDTEEDWLEPASAPYTLWKPTVPPDEDIASRVQAPIRPSRPSLLGEAQMKEELRALMKSEEMYLDHVGAVSSTSAFSSDTSSSGSSEDVTERDADELSHVRVRDLEDGGSEVGREVMEMKQAFVDRVMEDFYLSEKEIEDGIGAGMRNTHALVPVELMKSALKAAA